MVVAGTAAVTGVAGARALDPGLPGFGFVEAARNNAGAHGPALAWLLLVSSLPVTLFFSHLANESFRVMLPNAKKLHTIAAVGIGATLITISGLPANLPSFITFLAALAAPVCGIMVADYWSHKRRWAHPRPGINYAGYGAWILGFLAGLLPLMPLPKHIAALVHPAAVLSFATGFAGYLLLCEMGLKPYRERWLRRVPPGLPEDDSESPIVHEVPKRSDPGGSGPREI